jgi:F-type H+-transporting ATPase subunit b
MRLPAALSPRALPAGERPAAPWPAAPYPAVLRGVAPGVLVLSAAVLWAAVLWPGKARAAGGMPQLDFANPLTISQVVWGAVIFALLYVVLSRVGLPRVGAVLEERARRIAADLETAQAAKLQSDAAVQEMIAATAKARAEAQATINAELDKAKGRAAEQAARLNERLEHQLADAEAQIGAARASAMRALRQVASETAVSVVTRLTGAAPEPTRIDSAVGGALSARGLG